MNKTGSRSARSSSRGNEVCPYDTLERCTAAASDIISGVEQQVSSQRVAGARALERSSVAPGSGKLKAGAANTAVKQVETLGEAKKSDAASRGPWPGR